MRKEVVGLLAALLVAGCGAQINDNEVKLRTEDGYTVYEIDACDMSGERKPNAKVDIGYGEAEYWSYTNEYAQVVKVEADIIELQNDKTEPVLGNGRYCKDEAKVSGTESKNFDQGHIIADSLRGVSNAYNITPQNSMLNRHGDQAYMEEKIREALKEGLTVTDFESIITYPDTDTQTPSHYKYSYKIDDKLIIDEFDNIDPDSVPVDDDVLGISDTYIINTNTNKVHKPSCANIQKMNDNNKQEYIGDISGLLSQGYSVCGVCLGE